MSSIMSNDDIFGDMSRSEEELMDLAGTEKISISQARAPIPPCGPMSPNERALVRDRMRAYELAHPGTYTGPMSMYRQFLSGDALTDAYNKMKDTAEVVDAAKRGDAFAATLLKATGTTLEKPADESGAAGGVVGMQKMLAGIGMAVRPSGRVDAATVDAINAVFAGWDDAPPKLRGGNLTGKQISSNLPSVERYLRMAIHGAQDFGDATRGWVSVD